MKYVVVEAKSAEALQEEVQALINRGWEPQGGVSVATYAAGTWWYFQALVLHEADFDEGT